MFSVEDASVGMGLMDLGASRRSTALVEMAGLGLSH